MITCAELEDLVADYLEGSLSEPKRRELERHVSGMQRLPGIPGGLPTDGLGCEEGPGDLGLIQCKRRSGSFKRSSGRSGDDALLSLTINGSAWS